MRAHFHWLKLAVPTLILFSLTACSLLMPRPAPPAIPTRESPTAPVIFPDVSTQTITPSPTPTPAITLTPPTPPAEGSPDFTGMVQIHGGSCCIGGTAGETLQVQVNFAAASPHGKVEEMRVRAGGLCFGEQDLAGASWQPYTDVMTFPVQVAINWTGYYVTAQFRDDQGNLSPVFCDDISVEGMPPIPSVESSWFPQIKCFAENEIHPAPGETIRGPGVTFSWPAVNTLPEGVFYRVFAFGSRDGYTAQVAGGMTRAASLKLEVTPDAADEIVWYVVLTDGSGVLIDHNRCSSFPASLLTVDPPEGIKGVHFQYQP